MVCRRAARAAPRKEPGRGPERQRTEHRRFPRNRGEGDGRVGRLHGHEPERLVRRRAPVARSSPGPRDDRARLEAAHDGRESGRAEWRAAARLRVRQLEPRHPRRGHRSRARSLRHPRLRRRRAGSAAARSQDLEQRPGGYLGDRRHAARDGLCGPLRRAAGTAAGPQPQFRRGQRARRPGRDRLDRQRLSRGAPGDRVRDQRRERRTGSLHDRVPRLGGPRAVDRCGIPGDVRAARPTRGAARAEQCGLVGRAGGHQGSQYLVRTSDGASAAFRRDGLTGPGDTVEVFHVRHLAGLRAAQFTLRSSVSWLSAPPTVVAAPLETSIPVRYAPTRFVTPGAYLGAVTAWNPSDTLAGPLFTLVTTVVVPHDLAAAPLADLARPIGPGRVQRYFLRVARPGATLEATVTLSDSLNQQAAARLYEPSGQPFRDAEETALGRRGGSTARFVVRGEDLGPGVYGLDVFAPTPSGVTATRPASVAPGTPDA